MHYLIGLGVILGIFHLPAITLGIEGGSGFIIDLIFWGLIVVFFVWRNSKKKAAKQKEKDEASKCLECKKYYAYQALGTEANGTVVFDTVSEEVKERKGKRERSVFREIKKKRTPIITEYQCKYCGHTTHAKSIEVEVVSDNVTAATPWQDTPPGMLDQTSDFLNKHSKTSYSKAGNRIQPTFPSRRK